MPALTPEQIKKAKALRDNGVSTNRIRKLFGVSHDTVARAIDEVYAERRRQANLESHRRSTGYYDRMGIRREQPQPDIDIAAVLASVPRDTRSRTARLLGDPLPGRSALDRRAGA